MLTSAATMLPKVSVVVTVYAALPLAFVPAVRVTICAFGAEACCMPVNVKVDVRPPDTTVITPVPTLVGVA